ncbi:MAG: glutamine amidotransferase [Ruminococcus sp.]|nr:glutamine amidotransferase [Ruminococcus sp.]
MIINILHLYPKNMNLYGDHGNMLALKRRLEWRGYEVNVIHHDPGDELPEDIDIIFGGGGQDSGQTVVEDDLKIIAPKLKEFIENGTPTLVICGLYQLFGNKFVTYEGHEIEGAHILDISTTGGEVRLIGNVLIDTPDFGEVVGYENHSGLTYLGDGVKPLGTVITGDGNNGKDKTEGVIYKNCIGTYLHGPILPKNPKITDFLISKAIEKKTGKAEALKELDDTIELKAHEVSSKRPR